MSDLIPRPIISLLADNLPDFESHATLDNLFLYADIPCSIPDFSKPKKVQAVLESINKESKNPLEVLGKIIEKYIEIGDLEDIPLYDIDKRQVYERKQKFKDVIMRHLSKSGLVYIEGGMVSKSVSLPSKTLHDLVSEKNIPAINMEFERALKKVDTEPLEAISASCNILESICKAFIEHFNITPPNKQDLRSLWKIVANELNFNPELIQDDDLKKIISGMFSVVDGISALRTHGSSAHGQGVKLYKPKPRHTRFAVNSAHTLSLFLLETWNERLEKK